MHLTTENKLIKNSFFTTSDWICFDRQLKAAYHDYYVNSLYTGMVDIEPADGNVCTYTAMSYGNKSVCQVARSSQNIAKDNNIIVNNLVYTESCRPNRQLKEQTIQLKNPALVIGYCKNYYHYVFDVLARLFTIDFINHELKLITSSLAYSNSFQRQWLDIISPNFILLAFSPLQKINFYGEVIFANTRSNDTFGFSKGSRLNHLMSFRNYILEKYEQEPSVFPKKVFIIRDSSGYESRSVLTNSNIYEALKNKGYMAVNPDKLSVHEQLILFNKATHIVSVHGAALANTLFCNENCKIIELIDYRVDSRFELFEEYKNYVFHNFWGRFLKSTALSYLIVDVTTGDWDKSVE